MTSAYDSDSNPILWVTTIFFFIATWLGVVGWFYTPSLWATYLISIFFGLLVHGGLHTYFSHRAYEMGRKRQFVLALLCTLIGHASPLAWATFHRLHHKHSDTDLDPHSPLKKSFFESYVGWGFRKKAHSWDPQIVADLIKYPEILWISQNSMLVLITFQFVIYSLFFVYYSVTTTMSGVEQFNAATGHLLYWYFAPMALSWQVAALVNYLGHKWGTQEYETTDGSRNNYLVAFFSLGIGWHNNHHAYPQFVNCGHKWWQVDFCYYTLWFLNKIGVVKSMKVYRPQSKL